jgi:hypothetical protein
MRKSLEMKGPSTARINILLSISPSLENGARFFDVCVCLFFVQEPISFSQKSVVSWACCSWMDGWMVGWRCYYHTAVVCVCLVRCYVFCYVRSSGLFHIPTTSNSFLYTHKDSPYRLVFSFLLSFPFVVFFFLFFTSFHPPTWCQVPFLLILFFFRYNPKSECGSCTVESTGSGNFCVCYSYSVCIENYYAKLIFSS